MAFNLPGTNPSTKESPTIFALEDFGGLDTKARRPAIKPQDFFWVENFVPIGPGNLRTLYDKEADPIYTADGGRAIIYYDFFNIKSDRYCAVFFDDGTAVQVNTDTLVVTDISATTGTFWLAGEQLPHAAQYQSKYLVIVSKVGDTAYWIWDGSNLFGAGTLAPQVILTSAGLGAAYTSAPTVTAHGGSGTGATFTATLDSQGQVTDITVDNPGSGYLLDELPTVVITGGGVSQDQARATATVSLTSGGVAVVTVTNGGHAYSAPQVAFSGGGGSGAVAFVSGASNGVVTDITVLDPGTGYTSSPTVAITDTSPGVGTGATAVAEIRTGQITSITVNNGGSGYVGQPQVIISEPNNQNFPSIQAEAFATVSAGAVSAITVTKMGLGYKSASVELSGGNLSAEAEVTLMPFGISGTSVETYQDRVWAFDDTKYSYTGADSVSDFSSGSGGGSKPVTDNFLKEKVVRGIQANGFLYRIADSSINVISNLQTSSSGVTTFNDSNVDPQIGTSWRDSVAAFGRALVFANPTGVYALYGGAAEKVSSPLDGLFANASFNTGQDGKTPTATVATIFGLRIYCFEFTTTDPYTHTLRDIICMWDGQKWFAAWQTIDGLAFLQGQEINSQLTGYGASDTVIHRLFKSPSEDLTKVFASKLASNPTYLLYDQAMRVYFIAEAESGAGTLDLTLENQAGPGVTQQRPVNGGALQFIGSGPIQFIGSGSGDLNFTTSGLVVDGYDDSMLGLLIGITGTTTVPDLTLISLSILLRAYAPNG